MDITSRREDRPWGYFEKFTDNEESTVKIISVNQGQSTSLQFHKNREEFWRVLFGKGEIVVGDETIKVSPGSERKIAREVRHRISAGDDSPLVILEIATGDFDEKDITRLEDEYGRV